MSRRSTRQALWLACAVPSRVLRFGCVLIVTLILAPSLRAQHNLTFEIGGDDALDGGLPGWRLQRGSGAIEHDHAFARSGASSLRVRSEHARSRASFSQRLDPRALEAERVLISAYVKTGVSVGGSVALRVRVADENGLIYIDRVTAPSSLASRTQWTRLEIEAPLASSAVELSFGGELTGRGEVWFDDFDLELIDTRSRPAPSPAAAHYLNYALSVIDEHALVRASLDWPAYRASVLRQARGAVTVDDTYLALRYALGMLGDRHSYLMTAIHVDALETAPVENARTRRPVISPRGEMIDGAVAYLRLPGFAGGSHMDRVEFAEALQARIADLDASPACAWIVDLRDNSGGNLWPMIAGLGPLLGDGAVGASVWPDGTRRQFWYEDGKAGLDEYVQLRVRGAAYRLRDESPPIAVVIDGRTASAGEILAVAFAAQQRARTFGETTRGTTTTTQTFPLSDGASLVLAVASTSDRHGRLYTGAVEPDVTVSTAERDIPLRRQPAIRAALDWLEAEWATPVCASSVVDEH